MKTLKINSQSQFLIYAIYFYRLLGISFGGLSIDKNGNIIKSPFWYNFGWLGFTIYSVIILFFLIHALSDTIYKSIGLTIYWITIIMWIISSTSMICSNLFINHKYGFNIIKIFLNDSLTKYSRLKAIKIIWIVHLIILTLTFILQSSLFHDINNILYALFNNLLLMPLYYSLSFISWVVSMNFTENIQIIRKYLTNNNTFIKRNHLTEFNNYMLINYEMVNKIDHFLAFSFISSTIAVVFNIMVTVYYNLYARKFDYIDELIAFDMIFEGGQLIQLILNCFINGKLYNETLKLLSDLDNININVNDDQLFKTLIKFKTSVQRTKCGFTIGGFAPFNELTLLQVNNNTDLIC